MADPLAAWDFSLDIGSYRITDTGPHGLHGQAVNMPTRGMTGHNFTGAQTSFRLAPREYGAIYFHDDDVEDVGWEPDFQFTIPPDLPSGVYAARLRAGDDEDYLPFCVRPPRGTATSRIAVLMPTPHLRRLRQLPRYRRRLRRPRAGSQRRPIAARISLRLHPR